jgi:hypothetical protein
VPELLWNWILVLQHVTNVGRTCVYLHGSFHNEFYQFHTQLERRNIILFIFMIYTQVHYIGATIVVVIAVITLNLHNTRQQDNNRQLPWCSCASDRAQVQSSLHWNKIRNLHQSKIKVSICAPKPITCLTWWSWIWRRPHPYVGWSPSSCVARGPRSAGIGKGRRRSKKLLR